MTRRVTEGVWLLDVGWPEPVGANAFLLSERSGNETTLVDAGLPIGRRSLDAEIRATGHDPSDVDRVLLTHYDLDHAGGLRGSAVDAPVYLGEADRRLLVGADRPPWRHHKGAFHRVLRRLFSLSTTEVRGVRDRERIGGFRALHTPGHNPGHTIYLHEGRRVAFFGDLVNERDGVYLPPPWLDSYDTDRATESIRRVAAELSADSIDHGCSGHGRPISPGAAEALRTLAESLS
ncbi:MAG: MBL fold metallo-hydrolase [Natronomonas sp.]